MIEISVQRQWADVVVVVRLHKPWRVHEETIWTLARLTLTDVPKDVQAVEVIALAAQVLATWAEENHPTG